MKNNPLTESEKTLIRMLVEKRATHREIGKAIGRSEHSVRNACSAHKWKSPKTRPWTDQDTAAVREWYARHKGKDTLKLAELAKSLGRTKAFVSKKARSLGLTRMSRKVEKPETLKAISERAKKFIAEKGHPRGALGHKHNQETRARIARSSKAVWEEKKSKAPLLCWATARKMVATRVSRYGDAAPPHIRSENAYSRCKRGRRPDLGNAFFRSKWEANYARYLRWLVSTSGIRSWAYEPQTFHFQGVMRGPYTYTPDFRVTELDGTVRWHEVKGWMDSASKGKLKRFAKHFPNETLLVIGSKEYGQICRTLSSVIPGWEP